MKLVDMNGLFESYVKKYIADNKITLNGGETEELIVRLYEEFEKKKFIELDGKTPSEYFEDDTADYGKLLKEHFDKGLEISEYFIDGAVKCGKEKDLTLLIDGSFNEDIVIAAIDILDKKNSKMPFNRYIDLLFDKSTDGCIVDRIVEVLDYSADDVSENILSRISDGDKPDGVFAEILSHCVNKDEMIKNYLIKGLETCDSVPEYCSYLINYDDESVLPELIEYAKVVGDKNDFKELNMAIEALGGEAVKDEEYDFNGSYLTLNVSLEKKGNGDKNKG